MHIADPSDAGRRRSFNVKVPVAEDTNSTLIIYVTAGFLHCWDRLDEDLKRFLSSLRQVIFVFITDRFRPLEFATHSYLLSILATSFPVRKFATTLEVYNALPTPCVSDTALSGFISDLALTEGEPAILRTTEVQATFSALVVSVWSGCRDDRLAPV